ncbi:glycosyltransferase [bacterium]|nr:glycosyltransferase [bacterium]
MHVLFVSGEYPPMTGGVGAYTAELGKALQALGIEVSVFTSKMAEAGENSPVYPQSYPQVYRWGWREVGKITDVARKIGADWLHVQYQTAAFHMHPAINFAPIFWTRRGLRVAWTYHDLLVPYLFPKAGAWLRRWVTERPAHTADLTIVTNEGDFQQLRGRVSSLRKIPIGSNIQGQFLDGVDRQRRRMQRGYDASSLVIAYFGFLNRSKGGLTLIDTLDLLVRQGYNAHLLMIGERVGASDTTNDAYLRTVEARISQLGLGERVKWTGHQPDSEVSADLNAADVLLMPYTDGVSLRRGTLMAGLANGCAIVTTMPQSPLTELVDGRDLLLVPPEDPSSAAAAVARIVTEDGLALLLRANARQAAQQFSWQVIAQEHYDLYAQ